MKTKMAWCILCVLILASCLQATPEEKLLEYVPLAEDVRSQSFFSIESNVLIVNLYGGVLQPSLDPEWFILTRKKNRIDLGELERLDNSSVMISYDELLPDGDGYQLTVKSNAFSDAIAGAVIVTPIKSGTWKTADGSAFSDAAIRGVAYNGSKYIAVGDGKMAFSFDGKIWAENIAESGRWRNETDYVSFRGIVWGAEQFVAVGYWTGFGSNKGVLAVSDANGENWTLIPAPVLSYGIAGDITVSVDPLVCGVAWGNDRYVAVGRRGWSAWSEDGYNWRPVWIEPFSQYGQQQNNEDANTAAFGNGRFIAGGTKGKLAWSTNGLTWEWIADGLLDSDNEIRALAFGGGRFIAAGGAGKMKIAAADQSANSDSWRTVQNSRFSAGINAVAWGGGQFLAVGDNGRMALFNDGIGWMAIPSRPDRGWAENDVIYCAVYGNMFVTGGNAQDGSASKIVYCE
jgi:hypothetical protein